MKWNKYPEVKPTNEDEYYLLATGVGYGYYYRVAYWTKNLYKFNKLDFCDCEGENQGGFVKYNDKTGHWYCDDSEYWAEIEPPKEEGAIND